MKFETKLNKILSMNDSDEKITELRKLGLSLGIFPKDKICKEYDRLFDLGYRDLAYRFLNKI